MPPPNLKSNDYYQILGCPRSADDAELKKAYRKLAVKVSVVGCGHCEQRAGRRDSRSP
jgi:hypothetical protein